jgi:hypothetical protein
MTENIAKSLVFAIRAHRYHIGIYPAKIFAELDAFYALENENPMKFYSNGDKTFNGIPIVPISKEGFGIYLSNGPVEIREFHDPDAQPIFPNGGSL